MPGVGPVTGERAAAPTGLVPITFDSGALLGRRPIARGRRLLHHVLPS